MDFPGTLTAVRAMTARWPLARAKLVEDKANGTAVVASLKKEIPGLIAVDPQGGKVSRVVAVSPDVEAGNVYLPSRACAPWIDDFISETAAFPNGAHDDQVDACSQGLLRLRTQNMAQTAPDPYKQGKTHGTGRDKHGRRIRQGREGRGSQG
jgi:predicted phage terminase large subunit-like protein